MHILKINKDRTILTECFEVEYLNKKVKNKLDKKICSEITLLPSVQSNQRFLMINYYIQHKYYNN